MKYAKNKKIGDFLVTAEPVKGSNGEKMRVCISHPLQIAFEADLFWLDESSHKSDGEAHLQATIKGTPYYCIEVQMRSDEYHLRINSPTAKGGIEAITWR